MKIALPLLIAFGLAGAAVAQDAGKSVWQGIYTPEQADRGGGVYAQRCGACHGAALNGTGEAPPLIGGEFVSHWDTMTVGDLFTVGRQERISTVTTYALCSLNNFLLH